MEKTSNSIPTENLILFDWLTFTCKEDSINSVRDLLGLSDVPFEQMEKGRNGYRKRLYFENISILYDGTESMGICVDMSGKGCRAFETYSSITWDQLFSYLMSEPDSYKITRLDCAFDDHTGILDIDVLRDDTDDHHYVSRSRTWKVEYGSAGTTIYHGSPQSDMYIRIYDKAAEQDLENIHWVRVELQMRDIIASGFVDGLMHQPVGIQFRGVLCNYLRYVTPSDDSNMSRWAMSDYWQTLIDGISRISCWTAQGVAYDVFHLSDYVINQAGNALDCYIKIFGVDDLIRELGKRSIKRSPKYDRLEQQYLELKRKGLHNGCNGSDGRNCDPN